MSSREDIVKGFIQKVSEIQSAKDSDENMSSAELKQIALDMGLSDEDWQNVQQTHSDHVKRGEGFLSLENYEDALYEYEQAHILRPDDVDSLFGLATAHGGKSLQSGSKVDREMAVTYARKCLQVSPDHRGALALISNLKELRTQPRKRMSVYIAVGLGIAALVGLLLAFLTVG